MVWDEIIEKSQELGTSLSIYSTDIVLEKLWIKYNKLLESHFNKLAYINKSIDSKINKDTIDKQNPNTDVEKKNDLIDKYFVTSWN